MASRSCRGDALWRPQRREVDDLARSRHESQTTRALTTWSSPAGSSPTWTRSSFPGWTPRSLSLGVVPRRHGGGRKRGSSTEGRVRPTISSTMGRRWCGRQPRHGSPTDLRPGREVGVKSQSCASSGPTRTPKRAQRLGAAARVLAAVGLPNRGCRRRTRGEPPASPPNCRIDLFRVVASEGSAATIWIASNRPSRQVGIDAGAPGHMARLRTWRNACCRSERPSEHADQFIGGAVRGVPELPSSDAVSPLLRQTQMHPRRQD